MPRARRQAEYLKPLITAQFVPRADAPRETGLHVLRATREGRRGGRRATAVPEARSASVIEAARRADGGLFAAALSELERRRSET